jgi:hypothetical protein
MDVRYAEVLLLNWCAYDWKKKKDKMHGMKNYHYYLVIADIKGKVIPVTGRGGP